MGRGSEVAREVADVVLMDDNIATMIAAIEQGRTTRADIRKAVHFMAATNMSEILVEFGAVAGGWGQALNPRQLLWVNLLTDIFPELALAVDPPEREVLREPPCDPTAPFFSGREFRRIGLESAFITGAVLSCYGAGVRRYGVGPQASTMAFLTISAAQLLHAITTRSESHSIFDPGSLPRNTYVPFALGAGLLVELLSLVLPGLRRLLGTAPIRGADLGICCGASLASFLVNEIWKSAARGRAGPAAALAPAGSPEAADPVALLSE
jgi:Ca2+-transporting ATPase